MSCEYVQERISPLLDDQVAAEERETVLAHLESCRACGAQYQAMQSMRAELLATNRPAVPAYLQQRLQVMASHERVRRLNRLTMRARAANVAARVHLLFDNLMRPFGVPFASGLVSAMLLFALLAPSLSFAIPSSDVGPTPVVTFPTGRVVGAIGEFSARIEDPDAVASDHWATVLELKIDPKGKVWDYKVLQGELTPDLKELILLSQFTPATLFGRPSWGTVKIFYHYCEYGIVRG